MITTISMKKRIEENVMSLNDPKNDPSNDWLKTECPINSTLDENDRIQCDECNYLNCPFSN